MRPGVEVAAESVGEEVIVFFLSVLDGVGETVGRVPVTEGVTRREGVIVAGRERVDVWGTVWEEV